MIYGKRNVKSAQGRLNSSIKNFGFVALCSIPEESNSLDFVFEKELVDRDSNELTYESRKDELIFL